EKGGESGPALVPRKASASLLVRQIRGEPGSPPPMPPEHPLPAPVVADFVRWIDLGAPDPRNESGAAAKQIDWKTAAQFWAFRPPVAPKDPSIDRLIEATLARHQLKPVARADRWTLIRRATFDLTGLPPTMDEARAFLADSSPDAFAT